MKRALPLLLPLVLAACATAPQSARVVPPTSPAAVGELYPGFLRGYLAPAALPDSAALLPPPPAPNSPAVAADMAAFRDALAASPERLALAARDAELTPDALVAGFAPALGFTIDAATMPNTLMLLRRSAADAGVATDRAKKRYSRTRPFAQEGAASCTPKEEAFLRTNGSFPSGHAAIGWMAALVLTDLVPDRQDALLKRGYDFGESRVLCRVHWSSDVAAGRLMAAAAYARLQSDPMFAAQRELARAEIAKARAGVR